MKYPKVSIIILNYNCKNYLKNCLNSLKKLSYPKKRYEIIIVDNASTDNSVEFVKKHFPEVQIIVNEKNLGFPAGNNVGLKAARGEYLILLNPDTKVDSEWLLQLVQVAKNDRRVGICTSKLLMYDGKKINSAGGLVNYLGFSWPRGLNKLNGKKFNKPEETPLASGASLLIKRKLLRKIGFLDEDYFLYVEDTDFSWRARLAGYKVMYVPFSIVYHIYGATVKERMKEMEKFYLLERNRLITILKNYSTKTLILLFPILLFVELGLVIYFTFIRFSTLKVKGYFWIFKNLKNILKKRKKIQKIRKIDDKTVTSIFTSEFPAFLLPTLSPFLNFISRTYWKIIRKFL